MSATRCAEASRTGEVHLALELVAEAGVLDGLDLVEVNPIHDHENTTAGLAVELAASAFGVKIL